MIRWRTQPLKKSDIEKEFRHRGGGAGGRRNEVVPHQFQFKRGTAGGKPEKMFIATAKDGG